MFWRAGCSVGGLLLELGSPSWRTKKKCQLYCIFCSKKFDFSQLLQNLKERPGSGLNFKGFVGTKSLFTVLVFLHYIQYITYIHYSLHLLTPLRKVCRGPSTMVPSRDSNSEPLTAARRSSDLPTELCLSELNRTLSVLQANVFYSVSKLSIYIVLQCSSFSCLAPAVFQNLN